MAYLMIVVMILLLAAFGYVIFVMFFKNKKAQEDREKHVPTTQDSLPFDYIRSGIVRLKNGGYRIAIEIPSINIDLMEASEKQNVLEQYREILNSVDFPFQFLQQSRIVDISEYLDTLETVRRNAKSAFIRKQLEYYSGYLIDLIKNRSILTKRFYIIIPFDEEKDKKKAKINKENQKKDKTETNDIYDEEQRFDRARKQLYGRATLIERSFRRFEIVPKILDDNELLDLFYTSYNKDRAVYQPLKDRNPADYTTIRVKVKEKGDEFHGI
jgi:Ca2+/Na+ antiporter